MDHADLYQLRETYNQQQILLCFNGPFSQGLIEEIGSALRKHLQSEAASSSSALDVFAVYVELSQNIREYCSAKKYDDMQASATIVISRDELGRYVVTSGNVVERGDGLALEQRINDLASADKTELKAKYKERLRQPRDDNQSAGLGLIDLARKATIPITCSLCRLDMAPQVAVEVQLHSEQSTEPETAISCASQQHFFCSIRVVI